MRLIIVNDFSEARGGATMLALRSAELLVQRGYEVVVLCGDDGINPTLSKLGVEIRGARGKPLLKRSFVSAAASGIYNINALRFIRDWIETEGRDSDVYHLHGWSKILSPSVFSALAPVWDRLVVHAHDFFLACPNGAFWNYKLHAPCSLSPLSGACVRSDCDKRNYSQKVWRVSRSAVVRGSLYSFGDFRTLFVLHPGMCEQLASAGIARTSIRVLRNPSVAYSAKRIVVEKNRKILFVGRLEAEKGVLQLARAAARWQLPLLVVGDGPLRSEIESIYPDAECVGWQDRDGLQSYAKQARVLVMPSLYPEPFGLVAAEALSSGLPVVTSRGALLSSEIEAGDAGVVVDPYNVEELGNVLHFLSGDDARLANMSRSALDLASRISSSEEQWCDELEHAYERLCNGAQMQVDQADALTTASDTGLQRASRSTK